MKILLSTLNSKFIHSSLSIRYLKEYVRDLMEVDIREYTINQDIDFIVAEIYKLDPDLVGFSTYIWNVNEILQISQALKIVKPDIKILLGGPEVSYDGVQTLKENPYIDFVIYGEGEETFRELIETLIDGKNEFRGIKGLIYLDKGERIKNPPRPLIAELDKIPTPYENASDEFKNKIVYFESSRGCPFNCRFCLSSTIRGVRYFSLDRIKEELDNLIQSGVRQVKFVDRTFNANKNYSIEIMKHIINRDPKGINFHFEVTAHLLDREMLDFLSTAKEGLFQFEIGVQTTNPHTIEAIGRTTDLEKLKAVTKEIKSYGNIHQHLDLIAGLPYEDYDSFKKSFNDIYEIRPEKIQLGFLKLLKGSELREEEKKYGFKYLDIPPYEVLETDYMKYREIIKLKRIEDLVERYYNEGYFKHSLEYIIENKYVGAMEFFEEFSSYWVSKKHHHVANSRSKLYDILAKFYRYKDFDDFDIFRELLRFDFLSNNKSSKMPENIKNKDINNKGIDIHGVLKDERVLKNYLHDYRDLPTKKLLKDVRIERFSIDILGLIENKDIYDLAGKPREILFIYKKNAINRCETYDVSKIIEELM